MKKPIILTAFTIFLLSCNDTGKATSQVSMKQAASVTETFDDFNSKFHADSSFQLSRINFPLDGQQVDGFEKKSWSQNSWPLMKVPVGAPFDTLKFKRNIEKTDSSVNEEIWIEESGFRVERTFKLKEGKWFLVSYNDINL